MKNKTEDVKKEINVNIQWKYFNFFDLFLNILKLK